MEHIAALLLIVGCSQDLSRCDELPAPVPLYETSAECDADLPGALRVFDGASPRVMAICVGIDPALEETDADLVWDIRPDGSLYAALEESQVDVASLPHASTSQ